MWRLIDLLRRAGATTKAAVLRQAIDADTGTLADGHDYDWIPSPASSCAATASGPASNWPPSLVTPSPPPLPTCCAPQPDWDPINEDLARKAMRALGRVGDAAGVRAILHQLRAALDDIDEEPSAETIALAAQLQLDIASASTAADDQTRTVAGNDPR